MKVRNVIKGLKMMGDVNLVMFNGYGFAPIGYALDDLMKYADSEEKIMDANINHLEIRNNVCTLYGCFEQYLIKGDK